MEMYIQQTEGLKAIGGGKETRQEIEQLKQLQQDSEGRISRIEQTQATEDTAGLVTLCDLPDVTDSTGKALSTSEKNAAREGTMAHAIAQLQEQTAPDGNINTDILDWALKNSGRLPACGYCGYESGAGDRPGGGEYSVLAFGAGGRMTVMAAEYGMGTHKVYVRDRFGRWQGDWAELH